MGRRVATAAAGVSIGCVIVLVTLAPGAGRSAAGQLALPTSTILPVFAQLSVSPPSGPPGTVITVDRGRFGPGCAHGLGDFVDLTLSRPDGEPLAPTQGGLPLMLTVPPSLVGSAELVISGVCASGGSTLFPYQQALFEVTSTTAPSTATSTTTTAPSSTPIVRITATQPPMMALGCDASHITVYSGSIVLSRSGSTASTLTVAYHATGPIEPTPGTITFAAGESTATITLTPLKQQPVADEGVDVSLLDGTAYDLGDPSSTHTSVAVAVPDCFGGSTVATSTTTTTTTAPPTPQLPRTGSDSTSWFVLGATFVCAGAALVAAKRRNTA